VVRCCCESKKIADAYLFFFSLGAAEAGGAGRGCCSLITGMLCAQARPLCSTRAGAVQLQQTTHRTKVTLQIQTIKIKFFYRTNWSQISVQKSVFNPNSCLIKQKN